MINTEEFNNDTSLKGNRVLLAMSKKNYQKLIYVMSHCSRSMYPFYREQTVFELLKNLLL